MEYTKLKESIAYRKKRQIKVAIILIFIILILSSVVLLLGNTFYSPTTVLKVLLGEAIEGAGYAIWKVRLPRMLAGVLVGFLFGLSGIIFQSVLKNPLASPDIIGISSSSSLAAALMILFFSSSWGITSLISVIFSLSIAILMYVLSTYKGFSMSKLILIGIGIQAIMRAMISFILMKVHTHDLGVILRWMSGSLNGIQLEQVKLLFLFSFPAVIIIFFISDRMKILELGDYFATVLGVRVALTNVLLILFSVIIVSFATAVTGPIACVTFLSGPIATRLVGERSYALWHSALIGVILVLSSDIVGQFLLSSKFPVGIITGILGAPYLLYLLIKINQKGGI